MTNIYINYSEGVGASTQVEDGLLDYAHASGSRCRAGNYGNCEKIGSTWSCLSDACHSCPPGKYSRFGAGAKTECLDCELGRFSNESATKSCSSCSAGHYATADMRDADGNGVISGATFCLPCPAGRYQAKASKHYCSYCVAGKSSTKGSTGCTACGLGTYTASSGLDECINCERGKRATRTSAATKCEKCNWPWTSRAGSINCSLCDKGYFLHDGSCKDCPSNADCPIGTTLTDIRLHPGYWRVNDASTHIVGCVENPASCQGGKNRSSFCQGRSNGPYCAICERGYWKAPETQRCQSCANVSIVIDVRSGVLIGVASFLVIIFLVQMRLKYRGTALGKHYIKARRKYGRLKTKLKISAIFVQVVTSFPVQFNVAYPRTFKFVCNQLALIFSLAIYPQIPAVCSVGTRTHLYLIRLLSETLVPLVVIGFGLICYSVRRYFLIDQKDKDRIQRLKDSAAFWFLLFTYLIYPSCCTVVFAVFNCEDLGSGKKYMFSDYSTSCDTQEYTIMKVYAAVFIFIYPLGCPLMYFVLMWRRRYEIDPVLAHSGKKARMTESPSDVKVAITMRLDNHELQPIAFLFESYEPQYWWWEIPLCVERLLLTNANIYLASKPALQPFFVLMIALISVKFDSLFDPYILDSDDLFAELKDWALVTMIIITIIFQVHEALEISVPVSISIMLTTILLGVFGVLAYFLIISITTEISFFHDMSSRMFPESTELIERRLHTILRTFYRAESQFVADEDATNGEMKAQPDLTVERVVGVAEVEPESQIEIFEI